MRGDGEFSVAPSAASHIAITQGRTALFNDSEKGLLKCQRDGSPDTSNRVARLKRPQGRWKTAHLTSVMETSSKSPPWHIKLSKQSWERLCCPNIISWQSCTVNVVQRSKKTELQCSDSVQTMEMEDYQCPESLVQGSRLCLIPGVTQSLMTERYLRLGWNTTGKLHRPGEISERRLGHSLLLLLCSENAVSQLKANRRETNTMQCAI